MRVYTKAFACLHKIVIECQQSAECAAHRVAIVAETEEEIAFQPANIFDTPFACGEELQFHIIKNR